MYTKRCTTQEIYEIAEQVLLEGKDIKDFDFLDEDDRNRIMVVVRRGPAALSEYSAKEMILAKRTVDLPQPIKYGPDDYYVYIPYRRKIDFVPLLGKLGMKIFPMGLLLSEDETVCRKLVGALSRYLSPVDWAALLHNFADNEADVLLKAMSENLVEEVLFHSENIEELVSPVSYEIIVSRYSVQTALFLSDDDAISDSLRGYIANYLNKLYHSLDQYVANEPIKLGIIKLLEDFSEMDWKRLVGITSRREIALMLPFLSEQITEKLLKPLPTKQKEEVFERKDFYEANLKKSLQSYGLSIDAFKHWLVSIKKVKTRIET